MTEPNKELVAALVAFARAGSDLLEMWYEKGDDALVGYPPHWGALDDIVADLLLWAGENFRAVSE